MPPQPSRDFRVFRVFFLFVCPLRCSRVCNRCSLCNRNADGVALYMRSIPHVVFSSERQAEGHSLTRSQKLLLLKLLSSSNLGQLYLFSICSQAVLLSWGIVRRGNLSAPSHPPPPQPSLFFKAVVVFALMFLHCSSEGGKKESCILSGADHPKSKLP